MAMNGVDPYAYMQQVSMHMVEIDTRDEIETVLDELEYLFEVIPPDIQERAEQLISSVHKNTRGCRLKTTGHPQQTPCAVTR